VFVSTTAPGKTRGEHYHLSKIERFFVVKGTAMISLRRVLFDEVVRFQVKGEDRSFVDMPTLWAHDITNVGDDELVTLFWADQLLDPEAPDTYREKVVVTP
jgi:UDP-2-acetamido-2,6-beta-L-arabino-hexul-4-ose reductase